MNPSAKHSLVVLISAAMLALGSPWAFADSGSLADARLGFTTKLLVQHKTADPVPPPPDGFQLVNYPAPLGSFPAYVTTPPSRNGKYPAIVWIAGGFSNSLDDTPWAPATPDNDQSASAFRKAGIVTMYPSLRGGNNNPGYIEVEYGEVDDVIAAANYLATLPYVDKDRIYLGGHSTGGTLALLVAESTDQFRAVFSFGPVAAVGEYGTVNLPFDYKNLKELDLRAPVAYLGAIKDPTFVFEGNAGSSNIAPLHELCHFNTNPLIHFYAVDGKSHFSTLAPVTPIIASQIIKDTGATPHFSFLLASPKMVPCTP